jgi:hypothetical protein
VTEIWMPPVGPLVAARAYLLAELEARDNPLPVGINPPDGTPTSYALISRPGSTSRVFLGDYQIRLRVFDVDAVRLERNTDLLHRLLLSAAHNLIETTEGDVWITAATQSFGPASFDDDDVPLFGMQAAVFWTIGLKPESPAPAGS